MKVPVFNPDSANPFAEAAGLQGAGTGEGLAAPTVGAMPAAVGAEIQARWEKAVDAAVASITQSSDSDGEVPAPIPAPVAHTAEMVPSAPMANQWDRLSMTVASLVAWNLTNDVAPDSVQGPSGDILADDAIQVAPDVTTLTGVYTADESAAASIYQSTESVSSHGLNGLNSQTLRPEVSPASQTVGIELKDQSATISARIAGQAGVAQPTSNTVFREGNQNAPIGVHDVVAPTESGPTAAVMGAVEPAATMSGPELHSATLASLDATGPENPTSMADAAAQVAATTKPVSSLAASAASVLEALDRRAANTGQVSTSQVAAGQVDIQAQAVNPLASVDLDAQAASARRIEQAVQASTSATKMVKPTDTAQLAASTVSVASDKSASPQTPSNTIRPHRANQPSASDAAPVNSSVDSSGSGQAAPGEPISEFRPAMSAERMAARFQSAASTLRSSGVTDQMASPDLSAMSIEGGAGQASSMQGPVSDYERDFSIADSLIDAENITADEVPELPLPDASQIDIDIDDPGGQVRLDLSRRAEEVAVRFETPDQLVEEYRNLEQEIESALEEAGLTLADYEAESEGEPEERSDRESQGRTSSGSQDRDSGTEETPKRGRLLNRIV